ncbi:hypothetical protein ACFWM1_06210 [Nocardia sp. NPDC058379]|uniref:hypothetical protein n=1 Tax=unclassified Nocardia TaxID=2637762 RepID=UPI003655DFCD
MYTVDLLIVGRSRRVVDTATAYLTTVDIHALGATEDDEALAILDRERVRMFVMGGGVESESRKILTAKAEERGTAIIAAKRAGREVEQYLAEEVVPLFRGQAHR